MDDLHFAAARKLEQRRLYAVGGIILYVLASLAELSVQAFALSNQDGVSPEAIQIADAIDLSFPLSFYLSAVVVGMWIYQAHTNVRMAGYTWPDTTPGMAVGWFFIPFANLAMPFMAMRDLWHASHGAGSSPGTTPPLLAAWWGCFLSGGILMTLSNVAASANPDGFSKTALFMLDAGIVLRLASAWCLFDIMRIVTRAQSRLVSVAETFA